MKGKKVGFVLSLVLMVVVTASVLVNVQQVKAISCAGFCWHNLNTQNVGAGSNYLKSVYAVSSSTVYAVGYYEDSSVHAKTLIEHYESSTNSFKVDSSPNSGTGSVLNGVAFARNDLSLSNIYVWAVGYYTSTVAGNVVSNTLIEKYNSGTWSTVSGANPSSSENVLNAVAGSNHDSYYAVGYYKDSSGTYKTLIEKWNGSGWSQVTSPNQGTGNNYLTSVTVQGTTSVWAAGYYTDGTGNHPLAMQWNGTSWIIRNPTGSGVLYTASFISAADGFAAGENNGSGISYQYSTSGWTNSTISSAFTTRGLDYVAASSAWALGNRYSNLGTPIADTYYWNGTAWGEVPREGRGEPYGSYFTSVSATASNDAWGVGYIDNGISYPIWGTYAEHYH